MFVCTNLVNKSDCDSMLLLIFGIQETKTCHFNSLSHLFLTLKTVDWFFINNESLNVTLNLKLHFQGLEIVATICVFLFSESHYHFLFQPAVTWYST